MTIGRRMWAIAEGYVPGGGIEGDPALVSHETACVLNEQDEDAHLKPYRATVPALRTLHLRFNDLQDPEPVPRDTDFATVIEADIPVVVQHTRLDSRHPDVALLLTIAFPQ